jgi:ABC-2 type transport system permease protein
VLAAAGAQLVKAGGSQQIKIVVPAGGISEYVSNAMLIGLIVSVVIAAYACAVDANPALSVFYRSRARNFSALILPRVTVTAGGVVGAYLVGLLVAWYETAVLIGAPDMAAMLLSALLGAVYLVFMVAVAALAGTVARSTSGTVGITLVVLLLCPILGALPGLSRWMPSVLASAPDALLRHTAVDHYPRGPSGIRRAGRRVAGARFVPWRPSPGGLRSGRRAVAARLNSELAAVLSPGACGECGRGGRGRSG